MFNFSNNPLMNNIIEPNQNFDFSKLSLANPSGIQGGAYFTKILYNSKPLYIQTQQSLTRQGFVKTGKKFYLDLMFDNNSSNIINWFENLEDKCQKLLFEKSDSWFQNTLELNDIEAAFNSTIRVYKSGKYYLVRCNSKSNINNDPAVKIYDENESTIPYVDINSETKIISILDIQGIKFTSRNFQIEIEVKQIMVINDEPIFDSCLIKTNNTKYISHENNVFEDNHKNIEKNTENKINNNNLDIYLENNKIPETQNKETNKPLNNYLDINDDLNITNNIVNNTDDNIDKKNDIDNKTNDIQKSNNSNMEINLEIEDLDNFNEENNDDLKEIAIDINNNTNNLETLTLKKPNQVYFELYKKAKEKAKMAKKAAIIAYLEVKNIKKTYMIDNLNDSDSDSDGEFDADMNNVLENDSESNF